MDLCFDIVEQLEDFAKAHGHSLVELALSWLVSKPYVGGVIAGATSPEQVRANVKAAFAWALSNSEIAQVENITRNDAAFTWNAGFPKDTPLPEGASADGVLDVRNQEADISLSGQRI